MKKGFFIIFLGAIIPWVIYLIINDIIELANFIVTTGAFGAAIYAIYYQHQESKKAEENFDKQFSLQKEAALKQEIIGAWQLLANKAPGTSGKKEAIEFLASQVLPLHHIDMSCKTHGGPVYLNYLFDNFKEDREKISLIRADFSGAHLEWADFSGAHLELANFSGAHLKLANFSGAHLMWANFSGASLMGANFSGAHLKLANFSGAYLEWANFSGAHLEWANFSQVKRFYDKAFIDCYCSFDNDFLPKPPPGYKFELENRTDENNQPIYPENNQNYRYIKPIKLK